MYKISVPIAIQSLRDHALEEDLQKYLHMFQDGKINRVFIAVLPGAYTTDFDNDIRSEKLKRTLAFFKENGFEVGFWINSFGHGSNLSHEHAVKVRRNYQQLTGVMGESFAHGYCLLDPDFRSDYMKNIRYLASLLPDLIMLDDDFHLNVRSYYIGCFCPFHLKAFYDKIGEVIPREDIEERIFTKSANKYRDAYMEISRSTLIDFAKEVRKNIDAVCPHIRAGACMTFSGWDYEGTDGIEIARAFAGNTKPFLRIFGAPYHNKYILTHEIEDARLQMHWMQQNAPEIETFFEGDVYPRPRYNVPAKPLELTDMALTCDPACGGALKYMFDYDKNVGYESGYIEKHIKNIAVKEEIRNLFINKTSVGITVYGAMHKIRDCNLTQNLQKNISVKLILSYGSHTSAILSQNAIPTCYTPAGYPVAVCGESARHIPAEQLKNGAVLDAVAAQILSERGIDTGLLSAEISTTCFGEHFPQFEDTITDYDNCRMYRMKISEKAEICSYLLPENTPGAYIYENENHTRFLVFAADFGYAKNHPNYYNSYYRQNQLAETLQWLARKKLPVTCMHNPNLYIMTAKNENSMSILLLNLFQDEIDEPVLTLDTTYTHAKFVGCNGILQKDVLKLSPIAPYGFAAIEVGRDA